jgi:hypothetical protein
MSHLHVPKITDPGKKQKARIRPKEAKHGSVPLLHEVVAKQNQKRGGEDEKKRRRERGEELVF